MAPSPRPCPCSPHSQRPAQPCLLPASFSSRSQVSLPRGKALSDGGRSDPGCQLRNAVPLHAAAQRATAEARGSLPACLPRAPPSSWRPPACRQPPLPEQVRDPIPLGSLQARALPGLEQRAGLYFSPSRAVVPPRSWMLDPNGGWMLEPGARAHALWPSVHMCTRVCVSVCVCLLAVDAQPGSCLAWAGELWQPDGRGTGKPHGETPTRGARGCSRRALRVGAESDALCPGAGKDGVTFLPSSSHGAGF